MLSSSILDVAIGMAFIYLLLSLVASTVQEIIASILQLRPANLERGIRSLFSGGMLADGMTPFVDSLYRHGLIMGLYRENVDLNGKVVRKKSPVRDLLRWLFRVQPRHAIGKVSDPYFLPAYIPARTFAIALLDILKVEAALHQSTHQSAPTPETPAAPVPASEVTAPVIGNDSSANAATETKKPSPVEQLQTIADYLETLCVKGKASGSTTAYAAAEAMLSLLNDARDIDGNIPPIEKFRCHLENWYNDSMDRASGWYKKYTQNVLLVIGLLLAVVFNVDSINVGKKLWFDKDARAGLIQSAKTFVDSHTPPNAPSAPGESTLTKEALVTQMKTTVESFNSVSETYLLPVGWHYSRDVYYHIVRDGTWRWPHVLAQVAGWCITALALSLGAPFWFDLLNKFMVVRSTVKPSEKSRTEASKDAA